METTDTKIKKFIFTVPLQVTLGKAWYKSEESEILKNELLSAFPIIIAMNAYAKKGDKIKLIPVVTEDEGGVAKKNFATFEQELDSLRQAKGFACEFEQEIDGAKLDLHIFTPEKETIKNHLALYANLISRIGDNEIIYADITYGQRPVSMIMQMSLNYAYKLRKGTDIGAIVYGAIPPGQHNKDPKNGFVYDVSPLFFMDAISSTMAHLKFDDPAKKIKGLLAIDMDME